MNANMKYNVKGEKIKTIIKESIKNQLLLLKEANSIIDDIPKSGKDILIKAKKAVQDLKKGTFIIKTKSHVITFLSRPYEGSAAKAQKLHKGLAGKLETDKAGRAWIKKNIYMPIVQEKHGEGSKNSKKWARWLAKQLGKATESYWSSWTFGNCFKGDPDYISLINKFRKSSDFPLAYYPASAGKKNLKDILKSPESYKGKTLYCLFDPKDAPVYKGDGLFFDRSGAQKSYNLISSNPAGDKPSHMEVLIDDSGSAIGGNESQTIKKRQHKLTDQKATAAIYGSKCLGVFKKVLVYKVEKIKPIS